MKTLRPYQAQAVQESWDALIKNDDPVLLMASVGAGKSLMLADILLTMQKHGKRCLCIVNNAELVRGNAEAFKAQGGDASIYCAALGEKSISESIVFGTPVSILQAIKKNKSIANIDFNMIVVDEAHAINYAKPTSTFMRILRHYKQQYKPMRLLGATGTNFRFKGSEIVGPDCLFKTQVGNITTEKLINDGYLVAPSFAVDPDLVLDFSNVKIRNGQFDSKGLANVVEQNTRLTQLIVEQVVHVVESKNRFGCFLFATTKKHAHEIMTHLPKETSALILGDTPQDARTKILNAARVGEIKYIVNIAIISVGVDVPGYDTMAYLRPTESLVLLVQTMGRVLRLYPEKDDALVMDFAGNIERHQDWDNPVLVEAVKQTINHDKPLVIICPACQQMNTEHARRCVGVSSSGRCDYYFEFKECPECCAQNDISSRHCRECEAELIDPNEKLTLDHVSQDDGLIWHNMTYAKYSISGNSNDFKIFCEYVFNEGGMSYQINEYFYPAKSDKSARYFYGQFLKQHCINSSEWYPYIKVKEKMHEMLKVARSPIKLGLQEVDGKYKIKKKLFEIVE